MLDGMQDDRQDPLIAEITQLQRDRQIIVVAAVIGILASTALGMVFALGGLAHGGGPRNPGGVIFFVAPFAVCMAIGYAVHAIVRWTR
jgi:hypothetical protein